MYKIGKKIIAIIIMSAVLVSNISVESKANERENVKEITEIQLNSTEFPNNDTGTTEEPEETLQAPVLNEVIPGAEGMYIKFSKVEKADKYRIYIRNVGSTGVFEQIKEIEANEYETAMAKGGVFLSVEDDDIELGKSYEIMVRSAQKKWKSTNIGSWISMRQVLVLSADSNILRGDMPQKKVEEVKVSLVNQSQTKVQWEKIEGVKGYEIQVSTAENGEYQTAVVISGDSVTSWKHTGLEIGTTYYYKVYAVGEFSKSYDATVVKCYVTFAKPKNVKGKMTGATKMKLTWKKVEGASGYIVYRSVSKNSWTKGKEKKYKTIKKVGKTSLSVPKVVNGKYYSYRILAYTIKNGNVVEGVAAKYNRYADYYGHENESYSERWKRIYGKRSNQYNYRKSSKYMKTIKVKVWDFAKGMSGKKVTKVKYVRVHKKIAPTVKKIFAEIYKGKEKAPIYEIGGYSPRSGQHGQGLGLDINSNYNYMIDGGKVLAGSCWKPKKYAYSIKRNGDIEKAFRKYGFARGFWGDRKDYMHFSYFGT